MSRAAAGRARDAATWLFVPGDRPERFAKAAASGADIVVLDLEDAVAPESKNAAREHVTAWLADGHTAAVRVNAPDTPWHHDDLAALAGHDCAVMLPKTEGPEQVRHVAEQLGGSPTLVALIETARGVLTAREIAASPPVARLAFGSFDLAAELGLDPTDREALSQARGALVLASAAARLPGPVDGVTGDLHDDELLTDDAAYARRLGFTAKLCIHPTQVPTTATALRPSDEEARWARRVVDAAAGGGVTTVGGQMIDKPVLDRAHRILRQAGTGATD